MKWSGYKWKELFVSMICNWSSRWRKTIRLKSKKIFPFWSVCNFCSHRPLDIRDRIDFRIFVRVSRVVMIISPPTFSWRTSVLSIDFGIYFSISEVPLVTSSIRYWIVIVVDSISMVEETDWIVLNVNSKGDHWILTRHWRNNIFLYVLQNKTFAFVSVNIHTTGNIISLNIFVSWNYPTKSYWQFGINSMYPIRL